MPKARRRKKETVKKSVQSARPSQTQHSGTKPTTTPGVTTRGRPFLSPGVRGPQSLIFPGMVALGCWGMAFSFFVFSTDANHNLFAGMSVLIALLWTFSFSMRLRKLLLLRQKS
jgi:hypothetical protein